MVSNSWWMSMRVRGALLALALGVGVLALSARAAPAASVGHSGWFWGNPLPQGNTLSGIDFAGARGYAAGAFGTVLRTDDGGGSWTGISTGITADLVRVRAIDANTVVIGGGCSLRRSNDGGQSFARLPWTASDANCPSPIASFHFVDGAVGYLLTLDGSVFRTTDGGQTFSRQTSVPGTPSAGGQRVPSDIFFTNATTGFAIARGDGGRIFRTTDGGNSWVEVASTNQLLYGVTFATAMDGFAVGNGNRLLHTIDGGTTWSPEPLAGVPGPLGLRSIDCADATTCLIAEDSGGRLVRTTDAGATGIAVSPSSQKITAAAFSSAARAVAVGAEGATVVSGDGGQTWSPVGARIAGTAFGRLRATSAALANSGGANGVLARTLDGGATWTTVGVPTTGAVLDASFPNPDVGFAIDSGAGAFKTVNGGASWQILDPGASTGLAGVLALDPSTVLLIGPRGVRRSTDGGGSFEFIADKDVRNVRLVNAEPAGTAVLAYGGEALRLSTNGGQSWKRVRLPQKKAKIRDADFISARVGFALTNKGSLWRTKNAGRRWQELTALGTGGTGVSFSSPSNGYVTTNEFGPTFAGFVFHTENGGKSFQPQLVGSAGLSELWDAGATAFTATLAGSFFATHTGGQAGVPSTLTLKQKGGPKRRGARPQRKVKVAGTLSPPEGGEQIVISWRDRGSWRSRVETAASNGAFTSAFGIRRPSAAVAQWIGDDTRAGTGTRVIQVRPPKRR